MSARATAMVRVYVSDVSPFLIIMDNILKSTVPDATSSPYGTVLYGVKLCRSYVGLM